MNKKSIYLIENEIKSGDLVVFNNGDVLTVSKYNSERHMITFENGKKIDLYVIYDNQIKEIIHPGEVKSKEQKETKHKKSFSLYAIASGKPGRKFTIKEFLKLTEEAKKKPGGANTDKTIKLPDGYVYEADSQQEISTIRKLISYDAFKRFRGQCFKIPYKFGGKTSNYYPDFVLLTQTNKIVVMEVKKISEMNSKKNIKKYNALKRYCEKRGYLYIMCDKKFKPFERLLKYKVTGIVENTIETTLDEKGYFNYSDYKKLIENKEHKQIDKIRDRIGIYIKSHKNLKMVGDLTFNIADFRIIKRKKRSK